MSLGRKLIVGGEAPLAPKIIFRKNLGQFSNYPVGLPDYLRYYTFGAYFSLRAIVADLRPGLHEYVLLPSYLCPTIIAPFRQAGVNYDFYKMKEGLLPDLEDIDLKTGLGLKAILFIDYFGFPYQKYLQSTLENLRSRGAKVIQDTVQAWLDNEGSIYGDYCFNSLRKYSPFEASVLLSKKAMDFTITKSRNIEFFYHKRLGQLIRHYHVNYGLFKPVQFLNHIERSNKLYHAEGIPPMPRLNRWFLDRIDFSALGRKRIIVYQALYRILQPKHLPILPFDCDSVPLGLPVCLRDRDHKKAMLHKNDIHCPLHWRLSEDIDKKEHEYSWHLHNHELTLPVNVRLQDLDQYTTKLKEVLG